MPGHIEQTVAGQRHGFLRGALSVMNRLLAVARYAFRVGLDACARTPRLFRIETVKRVQWAGLLTIYADPAFGAAVHR